MSDSGCDGQGQPPGPGFPGADLVGAEDPQVRTQNSRFHHLPTLPLMGKSFVPGVGCMRALPGPGLWDGPHRGGLGSGSPASQRAAPQQQLASHRGLVRNADSPIAADACTRAALLSPGLGGQYSVGSSPPGSSWEDHRGRSTQQPLLQFSSGLEAGWGPG